MTTQVERGRQPLAAAGRAIEPIARSLTVGSLAGFIAGLIAGGIGSRIAMRITAIAAGGRFRGAITDAEETVGEITADGTIFLVLFAGLIGVFGGLIYLGVRRWVADAGRWRGLAFGVVLLAMFGWAIIEGDNPDFHRFGPPALNIAMFASIYILFGLLVAPLFELIERVLPRPSLRLGGLAGLAAYGFALLITAPSLGAAANGFGGEGGDRVFFSLLPLYALLVVPIAALLLARAAGRFERLSDLRGQQWAMAAALAVLTLPVVLGSVLGVVAVADIFEANR